MEKRLQVQWLLWKVNNSKVVQNRNMPFPYFEYTRIESSILYVQYKWQQVLLVALFLVSI